MDYTLAQLTVIVNNLTARLNIVDGQGLTYPTKGVTTNLQLQINSLTTDLSQLAANFESQLVVYTTTLNTLQTQLNALIGAPNNPPIQG